MAKKADTRPPIKVPKGTLMRVVKQLFKDYPVHLTVVLVCLLILVVTLKLLEAAIGKKLGKSRKVKSTKNLAYGDPLMSPCLWAFALLCIGKMIYNGFF